MDELFKQCREKKINKAEGLRYDTFVNVKAQSLHSVRYLNDMWRSQCLLDLFVTVAVS